VQGSASNLIIDASILAQEISLDRIMAPFSKLTNIRSKIITEVSKKQTGYMKVVAAQLLKRNARIFLFADEASDCMRG